MIIRVKKNAKDRSLGPNHKTFSRREFIQRGICTSTMIAALPHVVVASMAESAFGSTGCPAAVSTPGGIAQIHGPGGGFTGASYILNMQQLNMAAAGSNAANLWGIAGGANLSQVFSNGGVDVSSPFGNALTTPPPGISQGAWRQALKQCAVGWNFGAAPQDDGGGDNLGHLGAASPVKNSTMNTDVMINQGGVAVAPWVSALGGATQKVNTNAKNLTSATLAADFGITPSAGTSGSIFSNTAAAGAALGNLFAPLFGGGRTGASNSLVAATCGFMNDSQMASATFGTNLVTPSNISALSNSGINLGTLTSQEQAFLGAYYASTVGNLGGITALLPGADYHGQSVQNTIAPYDQEVGILVRMWLAAAMVAQQKSVMIITTNGSPGPNGTQNVTINSVTGSANGTVSVNGNSAQGDDGGSFSGHTIITYSPNGQTPPNLVSTGSLSTDGKTSGSQSIPSVPASIAALYFTGLTFLGFNTAKLQSVLSSNGITPVNLIS